MQKSCCKAHIRRQCREEQINICYSDPMGSLLGTERQIICQLASLFLVRLFTRRRSTAVSVTGFRMYPSIHLGGLETSNSSYRYHRQDLFLLLPHIPEYNSVFAVHSSFLHSSSFTSTPTGSSFKCHEV